MKVSITGMWGIVMLASLVTSAVAGSEKAPKPPKEPPVWILAYYPIWQQSSGAFTPQQIDYTAFSHLIQFCILPNPDGTISTGPDENITPEQSAAVVTPAHAAGRKVLVCIGGAESAKQFRLVLTDAIRPTFVQNLVQFVTSRGYDGVDIDMEPIDDPDVPNYEKFIHELRTALNAADPKLLLTAATAMQPAMFGRLQTQFDRIDLMTYDMSGPWEGWQTWHNAALSSGGQKLKSNGELFPSVQGTVQDYLKAGVPKGKLGIGIDFYGYAWSGATAPQQDVKGVTFSEISYADIMDKDYQADRYHWDDHAQAPYISIGTVGTPGSQFISYDDPRLCAAKVSYARRTGLGSVILWEITGDYRPSQPTDKQHDLLQSVKTAWLAPKP